MIRWIKSCLAVLRLRRAPRSQVHDALRNNGRWIANWHGNGVVYIPRSQATLEQLENAIPPLQLAKWQREREAS